MRYTLFLKSNYVKLFCLILLFYQHISAFDYTLAVQLFLTYELPNSIFFRLELFLIIIKFK